MTIEILVYEDLNYIDDNDYTNTNYTDTNNNNKSVYVLFFFLKKFQRT